MEAASISRRRPTRPRRRRRRSRAWLAALVYAAFAATAVVLVVNARHGGLPSLASSGDAENGGVTFGPGSDELALQTIGARAQRSTLGVGRGTGFVAWEANGLTLVLTARPAGGWKLGAKRSLTVTFGDRSWRGTLVRADAASGLGLVRVVAAGVADPLWDTPLRTSTRTGERLAVVGRTTARTVEVERGGPAGLPPDERARRLRRRARPERRGPARRRDRRGRGGSADRPRLRRHPPLLTGKPPAFVTPPGRSRPSTAPIQRATSISASRSTPVSTPSRSSA